MTDLPAHQNRRNCSFGFLEAISVLSYRCAPVQRKRAIRKRSDCQNSDLRVFFGNINLSVNLPAKTRSSSSLWNVRINGFTISSKAQVFSWQTNNSFRWSLLKSEHVSFKKPFKNPYFIMKHLIMISPLNRTSPSMSNLTESFEALKV